MAKKEFTVSIPSAEQMSRADACGIASGADTDKFVRTGFTPVRAEKVDAPYVGECPVVLECRVSKVVEIGTHMQFIGEILDVKIDEKVLDAEGKPVLSKINPLAFDIVHSEYYCPGKIVGEAFSAGKKASSLKRFFFLPLPEQECRKILFPGLCR
jgi:flavin reductase (DIM6/NTAB) family NADH-FMN oxidoreductase RutF